jgi:hypothetical protein
MASTAYTAWVSGVKKDGGRITVAPSGKAAAGYNYLVWGPRVNTPGPSRWPLPNEYSVNGQIGYYHPPQAIVEEIKSFGASTAGEQATGAKKIMKQWDVPGWLQSPGKFLSALGGSTVLIVMVVGAVWVIANRREH